MGHSFIHLLIKDFRLILFSKFLLIALGSLILYSCYISFIYVNLDQDIYPVYLYDPEDILNGALSEVKEVDSIEALWEYSSDGYSVGIDASGGVLEIIMIASGIEENDQYRAAYALSLLSQGNNDYRAELIGQNTKKMKNIREITCEFLFIELTAVGFLGLASMIFKEKQMGVIRVHGVLPVYKAAFIISKLLLFLLSDVLFAFLLTIMNLGLFAGLKIMPAVLIQSVILSLIMALMGFLCALLIPDFKQFSLLYLVLAIFVTAPVFLAGQTGIKWSWIKYHPMYHLFVGMKNAYFDTPTIGSIYYIIFGSVIVLLYLLTHRALTREMSKEG